MTFNYKLVDKIISAIFPLPKKFGNIIYSDYDTEIVNYDSIAEAIFQIDPYAKIHFGISKMVIVSPNLRGVVIKIPFTGYYELFSEDEEWNENSCWIPFKYAPCEEDSSDYCLAEYRKYQTLKELGLHCFLAETAAYKTIDGVRIFLQEEVTPESQTYESYNPSINSKKLAKEYKNKYRCHHLDTNWIGICLDKYGQRKTERFLSYCIEIDPDILDDAHSSNYGYRDNGTAVLLDFSNYLDA